MFETLAGSVIGLEPPEHVDHRPESEDRRHVADDAQHRHRSIPSTWATTAWSACACAWAAASAWEWAWRW